MLPEERSRLTFSKFLNACNFSVSELLNVTWTEATVGVQFDFTNQLDKLYLDNAAFMELFLRKCVCTRYGIPCMDLGVNKFLKAYDLYTDPDAKAIDIVDAIKELALGAVIPVEEEIESLKVDMNDLMSMKMYVDSLEHKVANWKPLYSLQTWMGAVFGGADFKFDGNTFLQMRISKYVEAARHQKDKLLLCIMADYANNSYKQQKVAQYKAVIYNPVLGSEMVATITIDPECYEKFLKKILLQ